jgi:uncharacterized protein YjbI with pentapeptide repeats
MPAPLNIKNLLRNEVQVQICRALFDAAAKTEIGKERLKLARMSFRSPDGVWSPLANYQIEEAIRTAKIQGRGRMREIGYLEMPLFFGPNSLTVWEYEKLYGISARDALLEAGFKYSAEREYYIEYASVSSNVLTQETKTAPSTQIESIDTLKKIASQNFIAILKAQIAEINQKASSFLQPNTSGQPTYPENIAEFSKHLYLITKSFLDMHHQVLSPEEKGQILNEYIQTWELNRCELSIEDTVYASNYKGLRFSTEQGIYNAHKPMMAGFNLSGALLTFNHSDLYFLHINFDYADFSNVESVYSHFETCTINKIKTSKHTNLNQCLFRKCAMNFNDLTNIQVDGAVMEDCSLFQTVTPEWSPEGLHTFNCINEHSTTIPGHSSSPYISSEDIIWEGDVPDGYYIESTGGKVIIKGKVGKDVTIKSKYHLTVEGEIGDKATLIAEDGIISLQRIGNDAIIHSVKHFIELESVGDRAKITAAELVLAKQNIGKNSDIVAGDRVSAKIIGANSKINAAGGVTAEVIAEGTKIFAKDGKVDAKRVEKDVYIRARYDITVTEFADESADMETQERGAALAPRNGILSPWPSKTSTPINYHSPHLAGDALSKDIDLTLYKSQPFGTGTLKNVPTKEGTYKNFTVCFYSLSKKPAPSNMTMGVEHDAQRGGKYLVINWHNQTQRIFLEDLPDGSTLNFYQGEFFQQVTFHTSPVSVTEEKATLAEIKKANPNLINILDKGTFFEAQVPLKDRGPAIIIIEKSDKSKDITITLDQIQNFYTGITIKHMGKEHYETLSTLSSQKEYKYYLTVTPELSLKSDKEIAAEQQAVSSSVSAPKPSINTLSNNKHSTFSNTSTHRVPSSSLNVSTSETKPAVARPFGFLSPAGTQGNLSSSQPEITKNHVQEKINILFDLKCTFYNSTLGLSIDMPRGINPQKLNDCVSQLEAKGIIVETRLESTYCPAELRIKNEKLLESLYEKLNTSPQSAYAM